MALDFTYPYIERREEPNSQELFLNAISKLGSGLLQAKQLKEQRTRQTMLDDIMKSKEQREQGQFRSEYGDPRLQAQLEGEALPNFNSSALSQPGNRLNMFAPKTMQSPVIAQFEQWQQKNKRMPQQTFKDDPELFSRAYGTKQAEFMRKTAEPSDMTWERDYKERQLDLDRRRVGAMETDKTFKAKQATEKQDVINRSLRDRADLVIQKTDQALGKISGWNTGGMAGTRNIPFIGQATGATNLEGDLDTIKALLGFEQLEQMKSQSRAGASGLGQLSDREMRLLTAARANLEQAQTANQLRQRLTEVKTHFQNWRMMEEGINPYENGADGGMRPNQFGGKIRVSNGAETFEIDLSDLQEAMREGFRVMQ